MKSSLYRRRWMPESDGPPRSIYLAHGISEHSGRYDELGEWLAGLGWMVGAHDHHGFGQSGGRRGIMRSATAYVDDTASCLQEFARETATRPILLGHSMGGVIALKTVMTHQTDVSGLILSGPAMRPVLPGSQRLQLRLLGAIAPNLVIERLLDPRKLSHDLSVVAAHHADELVHGFVSAKMVQWIVDTGEACLERAGALSVPALLLASATDPVVNPAGIRELAGKVPASLLTQHWYDDYLHEVLNEEPTRRSRVYADLLAWMNSLHPG